MLKGKIILISGPSGSGKTTIRKMIERDFSDRLVFSVSYNTRPKRNDEVEGRDYFFVSEEKFLEMIRNEEFIEWANVYGHLKGTSKSYIKNIIDSGKNILLELDVQGSEKIINMYPNVLSIFIMPPSIEELERRIRNRKGDTEDQINIRIKKAKEEIEKSYFFKHVVINDNLEESYKKIKNLIENYLVKNCLEENSIRS
ncbi:MAG: guanylate kinase [Spirochaetes bacterium]|nr:guanylate kinase [Spirochaetota bacterium]